MHAHADWGRLMCGPEEVWIMGGMNLGLLVDPCSFSYWTLTHGTLLFMVPVVSQAIWVIIWLVEINIQVQYKIS